MGDEYEQLGPTDDLPPPPPPPSPPPLQTPPPPKPPQRPSPQPPQRPSPQPPPRPARRPSNDHMAARPSNGRMPSRPAPKGRVIRSCDGRMLPAPSGDAQQMKYAGKKIKSDNDAEKNRDGSGSSTSSREKQKKSSKRRKTPRKGGRGSETQTGETGMEEEESSKRSFFTCNCVLCTAAALFLTLSLFIAVVAALHFTGVIDLTWLYLRITGKS